MAPPAGPLPESVTEIGDWRDWPGSLMDYLPSAARTAGGRPSLVIWHCRSALPALARMMVVNSAAPRTGQIILLNGTSSSGKSAIAEQLLLVLDRPFFHMSVDAINAMRGRERTLELDPGELAAVLARTRAGFHRAVAGMAQAGNDLVVDYVLSEQWRLLDCLAVLNGLDVVFVGVRCSEQELARREKARGDRHPGQAVAQLPQVHSYGSYDLECDTTTVGPRDCALSIKQSLDRLPFPRSFDRLRSGLLS